MDLANSHAWAATCSVPHALPELGRSCSSRSGRKQALHRVMRCASKHVIVRKARRAGDRRAWMRWTKVLAVAAVLNVFVGTPLVAASNQLQNEPLKAWVEYIRVVDSKLQSRPDGQTPFL